jgi:hypothetical protein
MEALTQLRKLARERRDKSIGEANTLYADTLKRIAAIEQDLLGHQASTHRASSACIQQVMPADQPFTTVDLRAALEAMEPGRVWYERTITNQLGRLRKRGFIRRLRRPTCKTPALYVRAGIEAVLPLDAKTMLDAAAELLADRPMNCTELAVAMRESGYQTKMTPKALRAALGVGMRRNRKRFRQDGGKWSLAQ